MSSEARSDVYARLRRALGRNGNDDEAARETALARLEAGAWNEIPARAELDLEGRIRLFSEMAEMVSARVERLQRYENVASSVVDHLRRHNLPMQLVMAADPLLARVPFDEGMLEIRRGAAAASDEVGLTTAFAGVAETGTLMLTSARDTPTMLAFLPDDAIVVLPSARVVRAYEDGWQLLREDATGLPRSINFVTGPSRTGDIEQTILLGAHGPRRLLILLVDEALRPSAA